jgi:mono/diheme cytochrome c family protein
MKRVLVLVSCAFLATACVGGGASEPNTVADPSQSQAQIAPPRSAGLVYAEQACARCHAVTAGQSRSPDAKAPTFEAIANTPGMTSTALTVWLLSSPHRNMPYVRVDPDQVEALSEYLYTLRR